MAKTGFLLVDGNEALGRAPAAPRHWFAAALIVIVAQWVYGQGQAVARLIAYWQLQAGLIGSSEDAGAVGVWAYVLHLLVPATAAIALALYFSYRFDRRAPKALGVDWMTTPLAFVWLFAGLLAATPIIVNLFLRGPDPVVLAQGVGLMTPVTIVQAGAEELIFRGVILASLAARYGARAGLLISAILFGLWHVNVGQPLAGVAVSFGSTFVFGLTAGLLTLHYANLGPALALHVIWNVATALRAAGEWDADSTSMLAAYVNQFWMFNAQDSDLLKFLVAPLLIETLVVCAACRDTIARVFRPPEFARA